MRTKGVCTALVMALVFAMLAGLGLPSFAESAPVPITLGYNSSTNPMDEEWWPQVFGTEMERILNIKLTIETYDIDKLNLVLASGDLPDLMMVNQIQAKQVLDGGLAVAMDDYLDEYGSNILSYGTRNDIIRHFVSNNDGKLYFHTPNAGNENITGDVSLWNGYIVRWDLYKQLGAPVMKNDDDYISVMKQMQALNPVTPDGKPVYGIGVHNDSGLWGWNIMHYANMGYQNNVGWSTAANYVTNEIISNYLNPDAPFWAAMSFYNKVYKEGLLDPDTFTMKAEEVQEKAGAGQYVGSYCMWYCGRLYTNESKKDPNTLIGMMPVPAENQGGWYGGYHPVGWSDKLTFVSTSSSSPETAVKVLDWMDSPDANRLHYSGVQGQTWDYVDGVPRINDETIALRADPTRNVEWNRLGINAFSNFIGASAFGLHTDGYYYGLFEDVEVKKLGLNLLQKDFSAFYGVEYPAQLHYNMSLEGKAFNQKTNLATAINIGISEIPTDVSRVNAKLDEMATKALPTLVQAKDDAEFQAMKDKFLTEAKQAGAEEAFAWWSEQWNTAKDYVETVVLK